MTKIGLDSPTGCELRQLADAIEKVGRASPAYSVALTVIQNTSSHLRAIARVHDMNQAEAPNGRD